MPPIPLWCDTGKHYTDTRPCRSHGDNKPRRSHDGACLVTREVEVPVPKPKRKYEFVCVFCVSVAEAEDVPDDKMCSGCRISFGGSMNRRLRNADVKRGYGMSELEDEAHVSALGPRWAPGLSDESLRSVVENLDDRSHPALRRIASEELRRREALQRQPQSGL